MASQETPILEPEQQPQLPSSGSPTASQTAPTEPAEAETQQPTREPVSLPMQMRQASQQRMPYFERALPFSSPYQPTTSFLPDDSPTSLFSTRTSQVSGDL